MPEEAAPIGAPATPPVAQPGAPAAGINIAAGQALAVKVTIQPSFDERLFLRCEGVCPYCGAAISYDHPLAAISDGLAVPVGAPAGGGGGPGLTPLSDNLMKRLWLLLKTMLVSKHGKINERIVLTCRSGLNHPAGAAGQPPAPLSGKVGAAWLIEVTEPDPYSKTTGLDVGPAPGIATTDDYEIEQSLASAAVSALSVVRKAAGDWRTGPVGLLAVVTAATLFKGADSVSAYKDPFPTLFAALGILVVLTGGAGLLSLLAAAHGQPVAATFADVTSAKNVLGWDTRLARRAHRLFRDGQIMTVLAALFVAVSAGLLTYGPRAAAAEPSILLSYRDSSQNDLIVTRCGKLLDATTSTITYQPRGSEKQSFPTNKLVAQTKIVDCP
jgi:hypothetical protein